MNDPYRTLGVSHHASMEDIRDRYHQLCNPDKSIDPIQQEETKNVQSAYRELCEWPNYHPYSDVFRSMHDFDLFFDEMEQKMRNRSKDVHVYSKHTNSCTRDGKTVTKVTENVNGDTTEFESYINHCDSEHHGLR